MVFDLFGADFIDELYTIAYWNRSNKQPINQFLETFIAVLLYQIALFRKQKDFSN